MNQLAVVNYAPEPHHVELRQIDRPTIGDEDCLVEVAAVGVCGSDLHQWQGAHSWPVNYPVVLGHEFAGRVMEVGDRVTGWAPGDRVCSETAAVIDPNSPLTRVGRYNLDPSRKGFGYGVDGAMTSTVRVPARCLHRVPDSLSLELAALTEPCCVAYSAVAAQVDVRPGDRVLVIGPGPIGLLCGAIAYLRGAEVAVAGLPRDGERLKIAEQFGCVALTESPLDWARQEDGLGVDGVVDAAGVSATLKLAIEAVRPGGWISKVGWGKDPVGFSLDPLVQKNVTLQGSFSHNWLMWERVLKLLASGRLDVAKIVGGRWAIDQWHAAFETMHSGQIAKALLVFESSGFNASQRRATA
jgi:alcohol dehydrogenase/L-iditol 2-dehydrogenase